MKPGNFFAELKRRKVFKVGAAYLVVAWLAVQAASIGFPGLRCAAVGAARVHPGRIARFPDRAGDGVGLRCHAGGHEARCPRPGSKALFAVAALLIVLALGWYFYGQPSFRKGDVATPTTASPIRSPCCRSPT